MSRSEAYISDIQRAHRRGELLAHMLEMPPHTAPIELRYFLEVLNGVPGGIYCDDFREVRASPEGFAGLPATALKKNLPIPVWSCMSKVGLLFTLGENEKVTPIHVSSRDAYSSQQDGKLEVVSNESSDFQHLGHIQDTSFSIGGGAEYIDLRDKGRWAEYAANAKSALHEMWRVIDERGWAQTLDQIAIKPGMNEVNVIAHLSGVKGLVIAEKNYHNGKPPETPAQFAKEVRNALDLREQLAQMRPELGELPICVYDHERPMAQLVALTPQQLAQPEKFFEQRHSAVSLGRFA